MQTFKHDRVRTVNTNMIGSACLITSVNTIGERVRYAREQRGWTQQQLADAAGVRQSTIGNIESNLRREPQKLTVIARALGFSAAWLLERRGPEQVGDVEAAALPRNRVPVLSWVQAGQWSNLQIDPDESRDWTETTVPVHSHTYALRVKGPSMTAPSAEPTFPEGCIIIVEPDAITDLERMAGQFVIVKRGDETEATFKKLVREGDRYFLMPLNPQWPIVPLETDHVFCGVVREKITRFF